MRKIKYADLGAEIIGEIVLNPELGAMGATIVELQVKGNDAYLMIGSNGGASLYHINGNDKPGPPSPPEQEPLCPSCYNGESYCTCTRQTDELLPPPSVKSELPRAEGREPREFAIHFLYGGAKVELTSKSAFIRNEESIDVIEKSAYLAVCQELDQWKSEHDNLSKFAEDLRGERDRLKSALEQISESELSGCARSDVKRDIAREALKGNE